MSDKLNRIELIAQLPDGSYFSSTVRNHREDDALMIKIAMAMKDGLEIDGFKTAVAKYYEKKVEA